MPCKRKLNVDYTLTANLYLIQRNPGSALTNSFKSQLKPQLSRNAEQITARANEKILQHMKWSVYGLTTLLLVSSFIHQEYLLVKNPSNKPLHKRCSSMHSAAFTHLLLQPGKIRNFGITSAKRTSYLPCSRVSTCLQTSRPTACDQFPSDMQCFKILQR